MYCAHPWPSGLTPAVTPNCGTKLGSTSLFSGRDETDTSAAATQSIPVENFIVFLQMMKWRREKNIPSDGRISAK